MDDALDIKALALHVQHCEGCEECHRPIPSASVAEFLDEMDRLRDEAPAPEA